VLRDYFQQLPFHFDGHVFEEGNKVNGAKVDKKYWDNSWQGGQTLTKMGGLTQKY